ncbi:MAG: AraC family transcriptional regulator [Paramuribaculum sp.]|nr:AraC family transcriptional regulator [Paramuribaculum sp.]
MKNEDVIMSSYDLKEVSSDFSKLGTDYICARLSDSNLFRNMGKAPTRLSGIMVALILNGEIELEVNLTPYTLKSNSVAVFGPDSLIQTHNALGEKLEAYLLIVSESFMRDINLDINMLTAARISATSANIITLLPEESSLMQKYFSLIHSNTTFNSDEKCVRSISRSLISATVYQLIQFSLIHPQTNSATTQIKTRRSSYVKDFIRFVHENHRSERSVAFYASKLFISPKYLSLIIKESTGRSAAEWIDEYVLLEAKNLLRFSGKNVQQIAYELNFTNQSSFGKYFKHLTGMSPTEYQKS